MSKSRSVSGVDEIHEISRKLEEEYEQRKTNKQLGVKELDLRTRGLESQIKELQEAYKQLSEHYHDFVKATVQYLKENDEKE